MNIKHTCPESEERQWHIWKTNGVWGASRVFDDEIDGIVFCPFCGEKLE